MDHNPLLKPWLEPQRNSEAGKGKIERPGEAENVVWQTRAAAPSDYERVLADALIDCFDKGLEEVDGLVDGLNIRGVRAPDGKPWTAASFKREMARLGA
jgi:hypothetical protein